MRSVIMGVGAVLGLFAAFVVAMRRSPEMGAAIRETVGGPQNQMASRIDKAVGSIDAVQRDVMGRMDGVRAELESMQQDVSATMNRTRGEVESVRRELLPKVDRTRSDVETMQHEIESVEREVGAMHKEILSRLDELRSLYAAGGEKGAAGAPAEVQPTKAGGTRRVREKKAAGKPATARRTGPTRTQAGEGGAEAAAA